MVKMIPTFQDKVVWQSAARVLMDQADRMQETMSVDYGAAENTSPRPGEESAEDLGLLFLRTYEDIRLLQEATATLGRSCPLMSE